MFRLCILFTLFLQLPFAGNAQKDSIKWRSISALVQIDSITIVASRTRFDIEDFIQLVLDDQSFYNAFKQLKKESFKAVHSLNFYSEENSPIASYQAESKQFIMNDSCRYMQFYNEQSSGDFFKTNGALNYYTASLYKHIFIPVDTSCVHSNATINLSASNIDHQVELMKQVIFNPGRDVDIPLLGKKMSVFSEDMQKYYDYTISRKDTLETSAYCFSVKVKPEFLKNKTKKTILKSMDTYFDPDDFNILTRNYHLQYKNALYDFDIKIAVEIFEMDSVPIPKRITYDGYWDLLTKKPEICRFEIRFSDIHE